VNVAPSNVNESGCARSITRSAPTGANRSRLASANYVVLISCVRVARDHQPRRSRRRIPVLVLAGRIIADRRIGRRVGAALLGSGRRTLASPR
jgi:hypothetical protein